MKKIFLIGSLASLTITFQACDPKKNADETTTVAQDKEAVKLSLDELANSVKAMRDGSGAQTIIKFLNLKEGEVLNEDWVEEVVGGLDSLIDPDGPNDDPRFDFAGNSGTYTWNASNSTWSKVNTPSNQIILNFPSEQGKTSNNAKLTLSDYTDTKVTIDGEEVFLPTLAKANLTIDGAEVFNLNSSAAYESPIPVNINTAVTFAPFTYTVTGKRITSKKFEASAVIANNGATSSSITATVDLASDDYPNLGEKDINTITASISTGNMSINSNVDMATLTQIEEPTISQMNSSIKTIVTINGKKVGDLVFSGSSEEPTVHIVYKDGSEEDVEVYYNPFIDKLEQILYPVFGELELN